MITNKFNKLFYAYLLIVICIVNQSLSFATEKEIDGYINFSFRDIDTNYSLSAYVTIYKVDQDGFKENIIDSFISPINSKIRKKYPPGKYIIEIEKNGYSPMSSWFTIEPGISFNSRYMLSPLVSRTITSLESGKASSKHVDLTDKSIVSGYVVDDATGQPLEGVQVEFINANLLVFTNARGYFESIIPIDKSSIEYEKEVNAIYENIIFSKSGYKTRKEIDTLIFTGKSLKINVTLSTGEGEIIIDRGHPLLKEMKKNNIDNDAKKKSLVSSKISMPQYFREMSNIASFQGGAQISKIIPPNTIRVGYNSNGRTCKYSCDSEETYLLEDYVRLGLGNEWIPSWANHSLRAGAIAYRSYGVYHVNHPLNPNYDICSSAYCQAFDNTDEGLTSRKTAGILLQRNGGVFFAEYSAENNNKCYGGTCRGGGSEWSSCGDGYVGNPPGGWPCLYDSVRQGHALNGHGRGMSQWGTSSWASRGKTWVWIVNHYYNGNDNPSGKRSAYLTSPIKITDVSPMTNTLSAGQVLQINVTAENHAGLSHDQIIIGARLYSVSTNYIDDVVNDKKIILLPGSNNASRLFRVPSSTPNEIYDLLVSLWLDIDEDGKITADDLSLDLITLESAISVNNQSTISTPSAPSASDGTYTDRVRISWNTVSGATKYKIYRCTSSSTSSCTYLASNSSSPYDDIGGTAGTTYYYRIKASNFAGDSGYSNYDTGYKDESGGKKNFPWNIFLPAILNTDLVTHH